jgi:hypothetical protein
MRYGPPFPRISHCIHPILCAPQTLARNASFSESKLQRLHCETPGCRSAKLHYLHACRKLHNMEDLQKYNSVTYGSSSRTWNLYADLPFPCCVSQDRKNNTFYISSWFGTTACKMAIKRHHQRQECQELLKMMSPKTAMTSDESRWRVCAAVQRRTSCRSRQPDASTTDCICSA